MGPMWPWGFWDTLTASVESANAAWWACGLTGVGVIVNGAIVWAAFEVQNRAFRREQASKDTELAALHISALEAAKATMTVYDTMLQAGEPDSGFHKSDILGRLRVLDKHIAHYLALGISHGLIVSTLITCQTLFQQALRDVENIPGADTQPRKLLHSLHAFRKELRTGAWRMIDEAFQLPVKRPGFDA